VPDRLQQLDDLVQQLAIRTNTQLGVEHANVAKLAQTVFGLVELLVEKGLLDGEEVRAAIARAQLGDAFEGQARIAGQAELHDKRAQENHEVDCEARMGLCRGACCSFEVPLSPQDLEERVVRFDPGRPYYIRHDGDGRCTHQVRATGFCGIYADRPRPCRAYSCASDKRIWIDFAARIPNEKAIAAMLEHTAQRPIHLTDHAATLPDVPLDALRRR
jgi:Fe-S-cluster containining protein